MRPSDVEDLKRKWIERVYDARNSSEIAAIYDDWAESYDSDMLMLGFGSTAALVTGMIERYSPLKDIKILDAGCGSGFFGEILFKLGYQRLIGIDISDRMLDLAKNKNAYKGLIKMDLGQTLSMVENHFDVSIAIGVLTVAHAPPDALKELLRLTKPGGVIIFTLTKFSIEKYFFGQRMRELEDQKLWTKIDQTEEYNVSLSINNSFNDQSRMRVYVYRKE